MAGELFSVMALLVWRNYLTFYDFRKNREQGGWGSSFSRVHFTEPSAVAPEVTES
jgi:hypothetical protein